MEGKEQRLWFLFQFLHEVEEEMSKEEQKRVMIEKAINLKLMCDYVVSCSYLDIVLMICMLKDEEFLKNFEAKRKDNKYVYSEIDAVVFPQIWGSTCTGFDVTEDGSPTLGGCAMTKEYTTVLHELATDIYIIFSARRCATK